ncbi:MAG TPA: SufD family Fe-S cluster assembly protein [Pyrodictium sp.]|nr:SufD family Fe-S cluster assembly protein [Pyrodictium sp.]
MVVGWIEEVVRRAKKALDKPPSFGLDPGLGKLLEPMEAWGEELDALKRLGVTVRRGAGGFAQTDNKIVYVGVAEAYRKLGVIVMPLREALKKISWVKKYYWRLLPPDLDRYTAATALYEGGTFIYIPPGVKVKAPINVAYGVGLEGETQTVHNVIVVGEGAEVDLFYACGASVHGVHVGVTELYLEPKARATYTMVHSWPKNFYLRSYTNVSMAEGSRLEYYYVNVSSGAGIASKPTFAIEGGARLYLDTVVRVVEGSKVYTGAKVVGKDRGARAEVLSKVLAHHGSYTLNLIEVEANADIESHSDCKALLLGDATVETVPKIVSRSPKAQLSHEASIGVLSEDAIAYLESKGFSEEEAKSILVYGFIAIKPKTLPQPIAKMLDSMLQVLARQAVG